MNAQTGPVFMAHPVYWPGLCPSALALWTP